MIISKTPLRVSFVGGGTDFKDYYQDKGGAVVSTAINKYIYVGINKTSAEHIKISYSKVEYVKKVNEIKHNLVREALKLLKIRDTVEIFYSSDLLPSWEGSGLGASSSILVGTLNVLHAFRGEQVNAERLAKEACHIEIDILKQPIGKQDQYAAAYGGLNFYRFNANGSVSVSPISKSVWSELAQRLMFYYVGNKPDHDKVLTEQKQGIEQNRTILDQMVILSKKLNLTLHKHNLHYFGQILKEEWECKKQLSRNITNKKINFYYNKAIKAGAASGKILGSGGGGYLMLYCSKNKQSQVRKSLNNLKEDNFQFETFGSRIIYTND